MFHEQHLRIHLKGEKEKQGTRLGSVKRTGFLQAILGCRHENYHPDYLRLESETSKNRQGRAALRGHTLVCPYQHPDRAHFFPVEYS